MAENTYSIGQVVNSTSGERIVDSVWSPTYGWLNLTNFGGIYTGGGGSASINELDHGGSFLGYAGTSADPGLEVAIHGKFDRGGITVTPDGGYVLTNALGERYSFGGGGGGGSAGGGSTSTLPVNTAPTTGMSTQDASAQATLRSNLAQFGLESLGDWAWQQYKSGTPLEQIVLDMRNRPEYKARFPYMEELAKRGMAVSEAQAIDLERSYAATAHAFGLPRGFYDTPDDFTRLIVGKVSPAEYRDRLQTWQQYAGDIANAPENQPVLGQLERLYGIGRNSGEFLAWVIDENVALPQIQRQLQAARTSSIAQTSGFGGLTREEAERLVGLGVSDQQAAAGFSTLAASGELFTSLDSSENEITRGTQIAAAVEGNAAAMEEVQKRARKRVAAFEGGSGFRVGERGISGL